MYKSRVVQWLTIILHVVIFSVTPTTFFPTSNIFNQRKWSSHQNDDKLNGPTNLVSALFGSSFPITNIRGGNSKFQYVPRENFREMFVYQLSQFEALKSEKYSSILSILVQEVKTQQAKNISESKGFENIQTLELAALEKGIFTICKWAVPLSSSYPLFGLEQCSQAELKSLLLLE